MSEAARGPALTCVGSSMVDLISYLERMPAQGETVFGRDFAQGFGGKGANQAVMAALLGGRVAMVNTVATDSFGRDTIENFRSFGIDVGFMRQVEGTYSGVANVLVDPDGGNRIILGAGANEFMTEDQVDSAFAGLPEPALVLSQLEIPQPVILRGFRHAKASGAITVLNPGPAAPVRPEILELTDWLVPNETEFALLFEAEFGQAPGDLAAGAGKFAERIGSGLVITLGEQGAVLVEDGGSLRWFDAPSVRAIDTTGAGDAFCGAFAYSLASGSDAAEAIELAIAVASDSVTRRGTQTSYARGAALAALVRR
ncbi:ribokinase [Amycolatopsis jejuensis]|uniref:ribokinase n=1 Tax=Amycolatopsis jejuensis TaxID=330084 RepID=UPI00068D8CCE|nr:ribokinase [Amycolatopsis jejuensis]